MSAKRRTMASPILISPSENWRGNDGQWSTLPMRLGAGNATQYVEVLVSTVTTFPLVIWSSAACPGDSPVPNCNVSRGTPYDDSSRTWSPIGNFSFAIEDNLGLDTGGPVGREDVGFGFPSSPNTTPVVNQTVLAQTADPRYWLGSFGVNPRPSNITNTFNEPQEALLSTFARKGSIPSRSYGYGEGAMYRSASSFTQLTLGGFDQAQMLSSGISLRMQPATVRDLVVNIRAITAKPVVSPSAEPMQLLPSAITNVFIDSTFPFIYLPVEACQKFEQAFGLVWNDDASFYFLNDTQHQRLLTANPSVTFVLGDPDMAPSASPTTNITLPYAAFDLQASYPWTGLDPTASPMRYFPLMRAANNTQYTLGRTFMQEAYLVADYERSNFTIAPRTQTLNPPPNLVPIYPMGAAESASGLTAASGSSSHLSGGAIAGIVVGVIAAIAVLLAVGIFYVIRKRKTVQIAEAEGSKVVPFDQPGPGADGDTYLKAELPAAESAIGPDIFATEKKDYAEAPGSDEQPRYELDASGVAELQSPAVPQELPSPPLPQELPSPPPSTELPTPDRELRGMPSPSDMSPMTVIDESESSTGLSPIPEERTQESMAARAILSKSPK